MAEPFEPLYTAAEMRAAEERYPGYPESIPELMERAGAAVAREAMLAFPPRRRFACVCGGGSNGGDGRVAARVLREAGHVADETDDDLDGYDVVVDALFGTGFHGEPRPEAAELIGRMNAADVAGRLRRRPLRRRRLDGRDRGRCGRGRSHRHVPRAQGRASSSRPAGSTPGGSSSPTSGSRTPPRRLAPCDAGAPRRGPASWRSRHEVLVRLRARRRRAAGDDGRGVPDGDGSAARGRRLRDARGAGAVAARRGGARARAREGRLERRRRAREARGCGGARERARDRARARTRSEARTRPRARSSSSASTSRPSSTRTALYALEPVERRSATVLTPHSRRARAPARPRLGAGSTRTGSRPRESGAQRFGAVVLLKGADTIVAAPAGDVVVCDARATGTGHGRNRRRAHRSRGVVPRERARCDGRGRRRSGRARDGGEPGDDPRPGSSRATS